MHMPGAPKLILAAFLTWPYDPEESQEPPCCLHTEPELGNLILSWSIIAALAHHLLRLGSKKGSEVRWLLTTDTKRWLVKLPEGYSHWYWLNSTIPELSCSPICGEGD